MDLVNSLLMLGRHVGRDGLSEIWLRGAWSCPFESSTSSPSIYAACGMSDSRNTVLLAVGLGGACAIAAAVLHGNKVVQAADRGGDKLVLAADRGGGGDKLILAADRGGDKVIAAFRLGLEAMGAGLEAMGAGHQLLGFAAVDVALRLRPSYLFKE